MGTKGDVGRVSPSSCVSCVRILGGGTIPLQEAWCRSPMTDPSGCPYTRGETNEQRDQTQ